MRFGDRQAGLRHVLAGEFLEVGGLLVGAAPVRQCGCDAAGRQDRQCQAHVAVRQRLGDQRVGDGRTVLGDAVEVFGDVDRGDAEFGGLGDQVGRVGGRVVGVVRGGPQDLLGEFLDRLDDHLLVVVGGQVEVVGAAGLEPGRGLAQALDALELTGCCAGGREHGLDAVPQARFSGSRSLCLSRNSWPTIGVISARPISVAERLWRCRPTALSWLFVMRHNGILLPSKVP